MISNTLTIKQLEALIWVADLGSFRKAAAYLGTTQPNISARIAALEEALGLRLMQREGGAVQMTARGQEVLDQARATLRAAEAVLQIAGRPDLIEDRLRLGVTELIATTWLRDYLRHLKQAYPALAVELDVDLSRNLDQALAGNALDLTLQNAPFSTRTEGALALGTYAYTWVAAPDIVARIESARVTDLAEPILTHARHTQAYGELDAHMASARKHARFVPSSSLASAILMAVDGMGVAVVPHAMVASQIADGTLAELALDWHPQPLDFSARFHANRAPAHVREAAAMAVRVAQGFDQEK